LRKRFENEPRRRAFPHNGHYSPRRRLRYHGGMNVTFDCPRCDEGARVDVPEGAKSLACPHCQHALRFPDGAWKDGQLSRCVVCPSTDLFLRKDFPQSLGVGVVVLGIVSSTIAYYFGHIYLTFACLFACAAIDFVLYHIVGQALVCYRCHTHYRLLAGLDAHSPFNLETHERYRQEAARLENGRKATAP
jgi:uncharacterized protein YbaR (Trm112 family)